MSKNTALVLIYVIFIAFISFILVLVNVRRIEISKQTRAFDEANKIIAEKSRTTDEAWNKILNRMNEREAFEKWYRENFADQSNPYHKRGFENCSQAALASQEPVGYLHDDGSEARPTFMSIASRKAYGGCLMNDEIFTPLYTSPQAQPNLQDAERLEFMLKNGARVGSFSTPDGTKFRLEARGIASDWAGSPREAVDSAMKAKG
jgi:hypothetical protein